MTTPGVIHLGIDTGGTFTDAALLDANFAVLAAAKAPTTRHDLGIGIAGAVRQALAAAGSDPAAIGLVGLSTTLATNAIVEGQGCRVGLVMIGFEAEQMRRADLGRALGGDPHILLPGGHSVFGDEAAPLDLAGLDRFIDETRHRVESYAVAGMFSVRNPAHEQRTAEHLRRRTGLAVSTSHELASALDGPRRALTALLNARLIPIVSDLIRRTERFLAEAGIRAPLMVVRGNGALMAAAEASARPVETILSGPAASAVGARFLTGLDAAIVADIGGTTTDIGILAGGLPEIDPLGARIGGYRTMVEAIRMATIGLGGDSEVWVDEEAPAISALALGPRRVIPIAALAASHPELVHRVLERQWLGALPGAWDGRFAVLARKADASALLPPEQAIIAALEPGPQPLDALIRTQTLQGTLTRLVARGLVMLAGLTPTDAAHLVDRQRTGDRAASEKAARLFLRRRNRFGQLHAPDIATLAEHILGLVVRRSADFIFETAAEADGIAAESLSQHPLARRALEGAAGLIVPEIRLSVPIIGLGAAAALHYPAIASRLGTQANVPAHAGVANAIGAVVGLVRREARVLITQPIPGRFRAHLARGTADFSSLEAAVEAAGSDARSRAQAQLALDGAESGDIQLAIREKIAETGGERLLIEAEIVATATGRPAIRQARILEANT